MSATVPGGVILSQADLNGETGRFVCRFAKWNEVSS
jgi:hypothetical protein